MNPYFENEFLLLEDDKSLQIAIKTLRTKGVTTVNFYLHKDGSSKENDADMTDVDKDKNKDVDADEDGDDESSEASWKSEGYYTDEGRERQLRKAIRVAKRAAGWSQDVRCRGGLAMFVDDFVKLLARLSPQQLWTKESLPASSKFPYPRNIDYSKKLRAKYWVPAYMYRHSAIELIKTYSTLAAMTTTVKDIFSYAEQKHPCTEYQCHQCPDGVYISTAAGPDEARKHGRLAHGCNYLKGDQVPCCSICFIIFYTAQSALEHARSCEAQASHRRKIGLLSLVSGNVKGATNIS
ncbi:Nn.00g017120.m01.CDS01 [Neocucurbitaria sp. VM-36]